MSLIKDIWDILTALRKKSTSDQKVMQDIYRGMIEDLKKELEQQKLKIADHKQQHPGNGKEFDEWIEREEKLGHEVLRLMQEVIDLRGQLIFWQKMKTK